MWESFLVTAILPPRSESHGGCTAGAVSDSSPMDDAKEGVHGLGGVLMVLAGRAGAQSMGLGLQLRIMGLLGWERLMECVGEAVGDGEEDRDRDG